MDRVVSGSVRRRVVAPSMEQPQLLPIEANPPAPFWVEMDDGAWEADIMLPLAAAVNS